MPQMLVTLNVRFLQIQKSVKFSNLQLWVSSPIHCQMYARISLKHEQIKRTCISMDCLKNGIFDWLLNLWLIKMFYLHFTLNFGILPVMVFQLEVYYEVDRLLNGLKAQQKGTTARWYSNKTSLLCFGTNDESTLQIK